MLTFFRKNATNWLIKVALFLIVIVFIFWGGYSYKSRNATQVARVADHYISNADYNQSYNQLVEFYRRQLGDSFSEESIRQFNLKKQALDGLIRRYVLLEKAKEMALSATTLEIQKEILSNPVFQQDGVFNKDRYETLLQQNKLTPEFFEDQVARDISIRKIEDFVKRQVAVTEEEVSAELELNFSQIQLAYVLFEPTAYETQVVAEEQALRQYYQEHSDAYKSEEKRQFNFVTFKPDLKDIQVKADEVQSYYESNKDDKYHEKHQVKARHILFKVTENAPEEEVAKVRSEAQKVLEEAKKGGDFAELAKKHSQEPGAAERGGDLGFFTRDRMVPTFSEAAFALKKDEISDLVRTPFGFHIIKVEDIRQERTIPFEEVKPQIEATLKWEKAKDIARDMAQNFADVANAEKDLKKAADIQKLQVIPSEGWLTPKDSVKELGPNPQSMGELFALPDKALSGIVEFPQGFAIAQIQAIQPSQVLPFEEVKERVEKEFKKEKAKTMAQEKAANLMNLAKQKKSLEEVAKEAQKEVKKSQWISRREPDRELPLQAPAMNQLFRLSENNPFPEAPIESFKGFVVYQFLEKKAPSEETLKKERSSVYDQIHYQKQNQLWEAWLSDQMRKADTEIFQEL